MESQPGAEAPRRLSLVLDGRGPGEMAVLEWGDPMRPVDLIFVHANGFNARTYSTLLAPLAEGRRVWAPDLRGHGRTSLAVETAGRRGWGDHRDDLIALLDRLDGPPAVLAGHSMGATSILLAAAERPRRTRGLVLFDPIIWSRPAVIAFNLPLLRGLPARIPLAVNALKRRAAFDSREQAMAAYRGRGAFRGWPDAVLADYLADGLVETPDGLTLACPPAWEASNYASQGHDPWRALRRVDRPVHILKAEAPVVCHAPDRPRGLPEVASEVIPGATHFFPMLQPETARAALAEALAA